MFDDKYYIVSTNTQTKPILIFDKNFNQIYGTNDKSVKFKKLLNKYYYENGENSRIIDENFKNVMSFGNSVTNVDSVQIRDKIFIIVNYSNGIKDIFDVNLKKIARMSESDFINFNSYSLDGINFKLDDFYNYIVTKAENNDKSLITIYDLNFKKIDELEVDSFREYYYDEYYDYDDYYYSFSKSKMNGDYLVVKIDEKYSLYKIGFGYILNDFYYIGDLEKDHFTYVNGFNYGFMDYDLNVLTSYSVFDNFDEDNSKYYY